MSRETRLARHSLPPLIVITRDLWGRRFEVGVEPPSASYGLRACRTHDEALAHAEHIHDVTGWAILDRGAPASAA